MRTRRGHEVRLVGNDFLLARWSEIERLLDSAFADSTFSPGFARGRPAEHTWQEMHKPGADELGHVVAVDAEAGRVVGAIFCLRLQRPAGETTCDIGWFFTDAERSGLERLETTGALVECAYEALRGSGYDAVVTEMGTEGGAHVLSRRHGFAPAPTAERSNRWIKSLRTAAEVPIDAVSEIRASGGASGGRRRATVDVAKGEVVIDFKVVLKGARQRAADTVQLGDGLFFRSTGGPLGLAHHCEPSCRLSFEDLTFRALRDVAAGEELTFNRLTTEVELAEPFDCRCGSPHCVGRVSGFDALGDDEVDRIHDLLSPYLRSRIG